MPTTLESSLEFTDLSFCRNSRLVCAKWRRKRCWMKWKSSKEAPEEREGPERLSESGMRGTTGAAVNHHSHARWRGDAGVDGSILRDRTRARADCAGSGRCGSRIGVCARYLL